MATGAHIRIDQSTNTVPTGTYDQARADIRKAAVQLVGDNTGSQVSPVWSFLDRPVGSVVSISGSTTFAASFTPDVYGTYLVQLNVNDGIGTNTQIKVIRVTRDANGNLVDGGNAPPAYGEQDTHGNVAGQVRGFAQPYEAHFADNEPTVATMAALRLTAGGGKIKRVRMLGYYATNDGGEGVFAWSASIATADNGGTIIAPASVATGRWLRQRSGSMSVRWFGAVGNVVYTTLAAGTAASTTVTLSGLSSSDAGKSIQIQGAGASGAMYVGTISSVSGTTVTISPALSTSVTSKPCYYGTDDTSAIAAAIAAAAAQGCALYSPAGTYYTDKITLSGTHRGFRLLGDSANSQYDLSGQGLPPTRFKLRSSGTALLELDNACFFQEFHSIVWDGSELATKGTINFPGTSAVSRVKWFNCVFMGAIRGISGSDLWHIEGANQVDNMTAEECLWKQNPGAPDVNVETCRACIFNSNGNAFNITIRKCVIESGQYGVWNSSGSLNIHEVQFFHCQTAYVRIDTISKQFEMFDCYNELSPSSPTDPTGIPFLQWNGLAGSYSTQPIVMRNCQINGALTYQWNCQAPLILIGNIFNGNFDLTPMATYGNKQVVSIGNTFNNSTTFTGTGRFTQLTRINDLDATSGLCISTTPRFAGGINSTGYDAANRELRVDGLYDTGGAAYVAGVTGALFHSIDTLTANRAYTVGSTNAVPGSIMFVSRHISSDGFTATLTGLTGGSIVLGTGAGKQRAVMLMWNGSVWYPFLLSPTEYATATAFAVTNNLTVGGKVAFGTATVPPNGEAQIVGEVFVDPVGGGATNGGALRFAANTTATSFMGSNQYYNAGLKRARAGGAGTYEQDTTTGSSAGDHFFSSAGTGAADSAIATAEVFRIFQGGGIRLGATGAPKILTGTGTPQSVVVADIGSLFLRSDGGTGTTLYVKEAGNGLNTGWVAK